jgi:hypothetical protein
MARYTLQQLTDLRAAMAEGVLRVTANGRTSEFRSLAEMEQMERKMSSELEGQQYRPARILASFRRD